jgi:copper chaperone CopZ
MNYLYLTTLCFILLPISGLAKREKAPVVLPKEVKIKVKGVVCSFCAYGVEKSLSQLTFIDKNKFSSKGVFIDIKKQMVLIAVEKGKKVKLQSILKAIEKSGYDAIEFYLNISGTITQSEKKYILTNSENAQLFELQGKNLATIKNKTATEFIVLIIADKVASLDNNKPIPVEILELKEKK